MRNNIAERRLAREWTQADLARALGVSRQTVISIERGRFDPSLPLAFLISQTFGCTIEDVFIAENTTWSIDRDQGMQGKSVPLDRLVEVSTVDVRDHPGLNGTGARELEGAGPQRGTRAPNET